VPLAPKLVVLVLVAVAGTGGALLLGASGLGPALTVAQIGFALALIAVLLRG
jgi:hypothetical protein